MDSLGWGSHDHLGGVDIQQWKLTNTTRLPFTERLGVGIYRTYMYFLTLLSTWIHGVGNYQFRETLKWGLVPPMAIYTSNHFYYYDASVKSRISSCSMLQILETDPEMYVMLLVGCAGDISWCQFMSKITNHLPIIWTDSRLLICNFKLLNRSETSETRVWCDDVTLELVGRLVRASAYDNVISNSP